MLKHTFIALAAWILSWLVNTVSGRAWVACTLILSILLAGAFIAKAIKFFNPSDG